MVRPISLTALLATLLWPLALDAQTPADKQTTPQSAPDLGAIAAKLERLERDYRAMGDEITSLRAALALATGAKTVPGEAGTAATATETETQPTLEEKVEVQGQRIEEQAQTKVEASQRFPIRLTGMARVNTFMNSRQNSGA